MATTVQIQSYMPARMSLAPSIPVVLSPASGLADECNFQYVLDVYISYDSFGTTPGTYTKVASLVDFPSPRGLGEFDISSIVQAHIERAIVPDLTGAALTIDATTGRGLYVWISVHAGCEYSAASCTDTVTQYLDQDTQDVLVWRAEQNYQETPEFFYPTSEFLFSTTPGAARRFLTDAPSTLTVRPDSYYTLTYHEFGGDPVAGLSVTTFDSSGATIQTATVEWTSLYPQVGADMQVIGVGPYNLNASTLTTGSQPVVEPSVASYAVHAITSAGTQVSEERTFRVNHNCTQDTPTRLAWTNRWGGTDHYDFISKKETVNVKRTEYEKVLGTWRDPNLTHRPFGIFGGERGRTTLSNTGTKKLLLTTDYITEEEYAWLNEELMFSESVYIVDSTPSWATPGSGYLNTLPVTVTTTSSETKLMKNKPIQFPIEVQLAYDRNSTRG